MRKEAHRGKLLQLMDYVRNNKIKTLFGCVFSLYLVTLPWVQTFEADYLSAKYRATERASGNIMFVEKDEK